MNYKDFENCKLCSWECGVDRLAGEKGVCMMGVSEVASCQLHPAPPQSYTVFMAGCCFRCLNCQNWSIAHYPCNNTMIKGVEAPKKIAQKGVKAIHSPAGQLLGADRLFFSGGSPTVSLPWIEEVVTHARSIDPNIKVNFDTNGFPSKDSFRRILSFSDSITFDIKAFHDEVHRALTGAPVEPVLRNVEQLVRYKEKLWEFRILVIPSIIDLAEIKAIVEFISSLDETLPTCFLAFRPNFCLDSHQGASKNLMKKAITIAQKTGLISVHWAGMTDIAGLVQSPSKNFQKKFHNKEAAIAAHYAQRVGCKKVHRFCGKCKNKILCELKAYIPSRRC